MQYIQQAAFKWVLHCSTCQEYKLSVTWSKFPLPFSMMKVRNNRYLNPQYQVKEFCKIVCFKKLLTCVGTKIASHHIKIAMGRSLWPLFCKKNITCLKQLTEASPMARTCLIKKTGLAKFYECWILFWNIKHWTW